MLRTAILFVLALIAFAGNSVINRYALLSQTIDANTFVAIRIISGALAMLAIWYLLQVYGGRHKNRPTATLKRHGSWWGAFTLAVYAVAFSLAYSQLETGFGALILFASVQLSMLSVGWLQGHRLTLREIWGSAIALTGLVYLVHPTLSMPSSLWACLAMIVAGCAWGLYSLHGRGSASPFVDTTFNFVRAAPVAVLLLLWQWGDIMISTEGAWLAMLSGIVTSGLGYAIWYLVLPKVKVATAAIGQLSVPLLAALGGVIFANERITYPLAIAATLIVGGMLIIILKRTKVTK